MNHKRPASVNPFTLEAVEDLVHDDEVDVEDIDFEDIQDELEGTSLEDFCKQLDFLVKSDDAKAKALFEIFKQGWKEKFRNIKVKQAFVNIHDLHPTQNVIYAKKSLVPILNGTWWMPGMKYAVDALLGDDRPRVDMGDPIVVCRVGGTDYLIDGHHRWSKAYAFNPECFMKAYIIDDGFEDEDDVLKFAQGTLTALRGTTPINPDQPSDDFNLYDIPSGTLHEIVVKNIDKEVLKHIANALLTKGIVTDVNTLFNYLWSNVHTLRHCAKQGEHDRDVMPQFPDGDTNPQNAILKISENTKITMKKITENTKVTLTLKQLKKLVKEGTAPESTPEVEYDEFKEMFIEQVFADGLLADLKRQVIAYLIKKAGMSNSWCGYVDRDQTLLALNVKYKGQGDWDKFNKDGRAEKIDWDVEDYWDLIQDNVRVFHDDWAAKFKAKYGVELYVAGRSSGYWGIDANEFLYRGDEDYIEIDDAALKGLYDKLLPKVDFSDVDSDHVYDMVDAAMGELAGDHGWTDSTKVVQYFKFTDEFAAFCNEFEKSVNAESAYWESAEFNDDEFENAALNAKEDDAVEVTESYRKYTQRDLRQMVRSGDAIDITNYSFDQAKEFRSKGYDVVGVCTGVYGLNGALLQDKEGQLYAVICRNTILSYLV